MADDLYTLKLGKGVAFVKGQLRRLRKSEDIWEADFRPAASSGGINATVWVGLVVAHDGRLPNERTVEEPPTVNDMARLLADAMLRPCDGNARRPHTLRIRKRLEWGALLPHLEQLGIRVVSAPRLARWDDVFKDFCRKVSKAKPATNQPAVEKLYPTIAKFVRVKGHIEIGNQEGFGFVARAFDCGGLVFEAQRVKSLADAMSALEEGLADRLEGEPLGDD